MNPTLVVPVTMPNIQEILPRTTMSKASPFRRSNRHSSNDPCYSVASSKQSSVTNSYGPAPKNVKNGYYSRPVEGHGLIVSQISSLLTSDHLLLQAQGRGALSWRRTRTRNKRSTCPPWRAPQAYETSRKDLHGPGIEIRG